MELSRSRFTPELKLAIIGLRKKVQVASSLNLLAGTEYHLLEGGRPGESDMVDPRG